MSASDLPRKEATVLRGHEGAVLAARFNGDGNYCLSCGKDRTIRLWNPHRGIHIKTYKSHGREVRDVHVTSYAPSPLSTDSDSHSSCINTNRFFLKKNDLSRDNSKLISCGGDRQIFYWDVATGRVIRKFRGHDSEVMNVSLSY